MTKLLGSAWACRAVVLLGIVGLALPVYGPALDPGYPEEIPGHGHLMFDGGSLAAHRAGATSDDGVVAVPNTDDGTIHAIAVAAAALALLAVAGLPSAGRLRPLPAHRPSAPSGWSSAPVLPPPKPLAR